MQVESVPAAGPAAGRRPRALPVGALPSLLGEVQGWSGGTPPEDDATLVVAKAR